MRRAVLRWRVLMCHRTMVRTRKTARAVSGCTARTSKQHTHCMCCARECCLHDHADTPSPRCAVPASLRPGVRRPWRTRSAEREHVKCTR